MRSKSQGNTSKESLLDNKSSKLLKLKSSSNTAPPRKRRATKAILAVLILILIAYTTLPQAWRQTMRREAYLPQLESDALANPFDGALLALLGGEQMQAGEYPTASETLRRALAAGERHPIVWLNIAAATAAAGDRVRANADLVLAARAYPQDSALRSAVERIRTIDSNVPPAAVAAAILPSGPESLISHYNTGSFLNTLAEWWGSKYPDRSGFHTREVGARLHPTDARAQCRWGDALLRSRRKYEALAVLQNCVRLDPKLADGRMALGDALYAMGKPGDAAVSYLEALRLRPKWASALEGAGKCYLETGLTAISTECYVRATMADPKSVTAWIGLGTAYRTTGVDHDKAVAAFKNAERLAPDRTDFFDDYADALRQGVQWSAAEALLGRRLKAAPNDPLAHYLLGMVMLNSNPTPGRQVAAEKETREALRLFPHNTLANLQLSQILIAKGQAKDAIDLLTDALHSNPYNRNAMTVLAGAYRRIGRSDLSEAEARKADQLYQEQQRAQVLEGEEDKHIMDPAFHDNLSRVLADTGDKQKATSEADMARLLRSDPKHAAEALASIKATRSEALPPR